MINDTCHIYLIAHVVSDRLAGPVKIGITNSLGSRIATIQTGNPREVTIAFSFATPNREIAATFERAFHEVFGAHRLKGEWFDIPPAAALEGMVANIRSGLKHFLGDDEALMRDALSFCGVGEAETLLDGIQAEVARQAGVTVQ
jgi:hypothetical protein